MKKVILCCNGLDKPVGKISRNLALQLAQKESLEMICPVLNSQYPNRYQWENYEVIVIDGCASKCATKIASGTQAIISKRFLISELLKENSIQPPESIYPEKNDSTTVEKLVSIIQQSELNTEEEAREVWVEKPLTYKILKYDKYLFRIPEQGEIFFTENDTWAYVNKTIARIGVTDYVQQNLSDILFFNTPEVGKKVNQFDEVGSVESAKAVFEVISPVSGTILRFNKELEEHPEWVNENPYEKGWIAEILLSDFEEDKDLLLRSQEYFEFLHKKVVKHET